MREVFVYPLQRDWREALTADNAAQSQEPSRKGEQTMSGSEQLIKKRYDMMATFLDEKQRRLLAGTEAVVYGTGGLKSISALLGMSTGTVSRGMKEARNPETIEQDRIRQPGGAETRHGDRSGTNEGSGTAHFTRYPWRPAITPALDQQEYAESGRRIEGDEA